MKEVMKHQQPLVSQNATTELSNAKGLRPILPKPADNLLMASPFLNKGGVQLLSDGSVTRLPSSIPVVILPTQIYMNMANKIAAQAAVGNVAAVGVNPTFVPTATEMSSAESANQEVVNVEGLEGADRESDSNLSGNIVKEEVIGTGYSTSVAQTAISKNSNFSVTAEQGICKIENGESEIFQNECSTGTSTGSKKACNHNAVLNKVKTESEMSAPCSKKTRIDKRKTKPGNRIKTSPSSSQRKQNFPQPKQSPLRPRPQPTLAAINSQANEMMSPGSIFNRNNVSDFTCLSPDKPMITPTKAGSNQSFLTSLLVSPLGCSSSGQLGLTPLTYGSDSGFFTPLKEGDMDYTFLFSPERFSLSKVCSTPQSCRKSLGLGLACKGEEKKVDSQSTGYDIDFAKL